MKTINIGLIGCGTVGQGVIKIFRKNQSVLSLRSGLKVKLHTVCDTNKKILEKIPKSIKKTSDYTDIINNNNIDIIIELIGGTTIANTIIEKSLRKNKSIVTANKALLAKEWNKLFKLASEKEQDIFFEAAVGGGIPVIKSLREGLISNNFSNIYGILNGTCNYILTKMSKDKLNFTDCLKLAQKLGYAEADPTFDINGYDTAHKIFILARLGYNLNFDFKDIYIEGIKNITLSDIQYADDLGYTIKLLAIAERNDNMVNIRVHPVMIKKQSVLANVAGSENAVFINGDFMYRTILIGPGAGSYPTASAVISDIIDVAGNITYNNKGVLSNLITANYNNSKLSLNAPENYLSHYYIRCTTADKPSVLSKISGILGKNDISIQACIQKGKHLKSSVPIILMTHQCIEKNLQNAIREIDKMSFVRKKTLYIRVNEDIS